MTYDPWRALSALRVEAITCRLPNRGAWWVPSERVVLLDDRLTPVERRCAVAHEVEHVRAHDTGCIWPLAGRLELRRSRAAAERLLPLELLASATWAGRRVSEVAEELDVDVPTLRVRLESLSPAERRLVGERTDDAGAA